MTSDIAAFADSFISAQSEGDVYQSTVQTARTLIEADTCQLYVAVPGDDQFVLRSSDPPPTSDRNPAIPQNNGVFTQCFTEGSPVMVDDVSNHSGLSNHPAEIWDNRYTALLVIPVDSVGLLIAADKQQAYFTGGDLNIANQLVEYTTLALDRIRSQAQRNARGEQLEKIINTFSHDLRTPLQVAQGYVTFAEETGDDTHLSRVKTAHSRMEELIEDMTRLAETGKRVDDLQPVKLHAVAEKAWQSVASEQATMELVDTVQFEADESRLCQLLENLFQNAVDHGPDDVTVRVGTSESGFYVEDDGPGIPPDDHQDVFKWATSSDTSHAGIGLGIVKEIVHAHGWEITITEGEAGGTRFVISGVQ